MSKAPIGKPTQFHTKENQPREGKAAVEKSRHAEASKRTTGVACTDQGERRMTRGGKMREPIKV